MSIDYYNLGKKIEPINKVREYHRYQLEKEYQVIRWFRGEMEWL